MENRNILIIVSIILIIVVLLIISTSLSGRIITITGHSFSKYKSCVEDDNGNNKFVKGTTILTVYDRKYVYNDTCERQRRLVEYYCLYDDVKTKRYWCEEKCVDGACTNKTAEALANIKCQDSDRGIDYYNKGETCINSDCKTDFCLDKNYISEFFCRDGRESKLYLCPQGCQNGVCVYAAANSS